jgi:rhodanese-related sulfurtransferase
MSIMQPSELFQRIDSNRPPLIIDARGEIEFKRGHIKGAINVPVRKLLLHAAWLPTDKDREVVVACELGQRAAIAEALVTLYGFRKAEFLDGFPEGWNEAGLPLEASLSARSSGGDEHRRGWNRPVVAVDRGLANVESERIPAVVTSRGTGKDRSSPGRNCCDPTPDDRATMNSMD